MLPLTVFIVSTAWRDETSISERAISGEMTKLGESNWVSAKGSPIGVPRSGSNRTAHRLKYEVGRREMKYSVRPSGAQRGLSGRV